jgi:hypothetical protein
MSARVVRGDKLAARKVGGEMVILSAEDSSLFLLNEVGTAIWEATDGQRSIQAIADALCAEYDVDAAMALADVTEFIDALAAAGIVSLSDEAAL